mgnify:CR=1 FL=1
MVNMISFKNTIERIPDISCGFRNGLGALGANSRYVTVASTRLLEGSVDIDGCTEKAYPHENRWDYVISYSGKAFFLEVHPATEGEVKVIAAKRVWLLSWLKQKADALNSYPMGTPRLTWVHSGKCGLSKTSTEYRRAALMGLVPTNLLRLK